MHKAEHRMTKETQVECAGGGRITQQRPRDCSTLTEPRERSDTERRAKRKHRRAGDQLHLPRSLHRL